MPATRRSARRQERELHNQHQPIFKLPPEVLSRIFVFTSQFWEWEFDSESCQGVIPAVCRHWRKIALDTTALWTRVGIADQPIAFQRSELHLSRCGPIAQLELMIDMFGPTWDQIPEGAVEECIRRVDAAFSFIIDRGGVTSRWKHCSIQTTKFHAYLAILQFLESADFPSLEYLEVVYAQTPHVWEVEQVEVTHILESPPRLLFRNTPPRLKTIRLLGIPNPYIFKHPAHPQLTGLTHLQLGMIAQDHELWHLNELLAANPQLKALSLCSVSFSEGAVVGPVEGELSVNQFPKVRLHNLQSLALPDIDSAPWALGFLMSLDAPNVKALRIGYAGEDAGRGDYLRLLYYLIWSSEEFTQDSRPYFPNLTHLSYDSYGEPVADLKLLLTEYTTLQSLEIPLHPYVEPVLKETKPWMVPNLKRLRISSANSMEELKRTVVARHNAGLGLEKVEMVCTEAAPEITPSDKRKILQMANDKKKIEQLVNLVLLEREDQPEDLVWCC
ncbi:unnamed protein product [Rhizoctonia solani]|uniref:F-box domain-containing protein n=1 Tax=Rhizoctonia solani TaxID=456999 RepID=A0A8H3HEI2_9AGAM|nr:unnamed protein product [Rhizoctonia solani]